MGDQERNALYDEHGSRLGRARDAFATDYVNIHIYCGVTSSLISSAVEAMEVRRA